MVENTATGVVMRGDHQGERDRAACSITGAGPKNHHMADEAQGTEGTVDRDSKTAIDQGL